MKKKTDLENAYSISSTEKGIYEVGIHVTDVSNYIRVNTPLDREARERSCAIQLVDKKVSILPLSFIESHCSLAINKERLAYSVMCRFTENGVLLHAWIGKTVVKVSQHLGAHDEPNSDVKSLLKICKKLQHNRLHKLGGISLAQSSIRFQLANSGYPAEIDRLNKSDEDLLMQELLIVANTEVAQKICSRFPDQALLYRQDSPKMSQLVSRIVVRITPSYPNENDNSHSSKTIWRMSHLQTQSKVY
jgi:protein SSD1